MASRDIEGRPERTPVVRKAIAGVVLIAVGVLVVSAIIHFIMAILWVVVGVVAVAAVLWALNTLLQMGGTQGLGLLVILGCFGLAGGVVGRIKGSSFWMWFLVSFCIPFIGLACAVLYRYDNRELRRQCPRCGRVTKLYDAVCVVCGEELEFPDTAIASEMQVRDQRPSRPAA